MKYYFKKDENSKSKVMVLTDDIKWEDIEHVFEEVDSNGNELKDDDDF